MTRLEDLNKNAIAIFIFFFDKVVLMIKKNNFFFWVQYILIKQFIFFKKILLDSGLSPNTADPEPTRRVNGRNSSGLGGNSLFWNIAVYRLNPQDTSELIFFYIFF